MSGKKNLIMGLWSRLPFAQLERFIGSLRRTTFDGDVCIFVDEVPPQTVAALYAHGVRVERASRFATPAMNDQTSRYYNYLDYLTRHGEQYHNVMISDLRDVVFQSDPFERPLPADIVFAQERCRIGESPVNQSWVSIAYGAAVANNLRDYTVSCAGTTFGTVFGMLHYLAAMTHEFANLPNPEALLSRGMDQGIHNYVIRMRPLQNAWFDPTDQLVATMHFVPDASVQTTPRGILIDGRLVPVVHQWDRNEITDKYVVAAPQFRLGPPQPVPPRAPRPPTAAAPAPDADREDCVLAYYNRERDAEWLVLFLASLRCVGFSGPVHCIGDFNDHELRLLSQFGCTPHIAASVDMGRAENVAHFYLGQVLDALAAGAAPPDHVMVFDNMRAVFPRNPFLGKTIGLSMFSEGPTRIGDSEYNMQRLVFFVPLDEHRLRHPIVSSALVRGQLDVVRAFYHKLLAEFIGRGALLDVQKAIQGAWNKLAHDGGFAFPVIVHPCAAEAYFDFWPTDLPIGTAHGLSIGGATPAVVFGPSPASELVQAVSSNLGLSPAPG